ncbi:MAG: AMP-binding protein [Lamprobacter sp.]|uniref:class I adenylate-forming enzyme family protein n=1 Tax=Lamprobacter sp. TaxID=3100796 RepID=UPI002B26280F|nr:AMP-binding protein [Lamprobacter sp.]MEA3638778.1 AMP-binding protein [Lamprobacter sp.]
MDSFQGGDLDLSTLIERRRALGDADALRIGNQRYSYAELATLVEQRVAILISAGVAAGELVLCPTMPVLDSVLMQWALARVGAAMLPVRTDLPHSRPESLIEASGAECWWQPADPDANTDANNRPAGALIRSGSAHVPATTSSAAATHSPPAPALLIETSGSSAEPKLVMLSAAAIIASCRAVNARLDLKPGDRWLCVLPRQHVGGLAIGYRCALAGAELVVQVVQSRFEAEQVQTALWDARITHLSLVPAMLERLLGVDPAPPPWLRVVLLGGQGLDSNLARRAVEQGWPLYLGYGMTETFSQVAGGWIGADGLPQRGLMPLDGVELDCPSCDPIQHQAPSDAANVAPQQAPSQASQQAQPLRIRGPMLMLGYANPTRRPGAGLDNGWLETSDLACRLPGGGIQILGRADDVVLIAGINVLPAEIEHELAQLDQITEIAIIGVPDPTWGHRLVALYVGELEPAQLEAWCRGNLPSHRRPRTFARLESLPTLSSGKPDRRALIARAKALGELKAEAAPAHRAFSGHRENH